MEHERLKDSAFYIAIIAMAVIFIYKLINEANLIWVFPLDITNDWASHIAKLFFLAKYGFYQTVPNWYGGFTLFKLYAPGWFFFTIPIYYLTRNLQLTTYISLIILFVLGLIFINLLGKINKFSITKRIAFFIFFFANPIAIGNFIRVGKIPEMFGCIIFIPMFMLVWYFKEHKIDWKVIIFIVLYSAMVISYLPGFAVGSIIVLSLFLIKPVKEKILIALAVVASLLITSFWWVNYLIASRTTMLNDLIFLENLIQFNRAILLENIATSVISAAFILVFYFYWRDTNKSKKELLFFSPVLFIAIALLTRIAVIIPYINKLHPDTYNFFILFITIFLFFKTKKYPKIIARNALVIITILAIISIALSIMFIKQFTQHTEMDEEVINMLKYVDGKMEMVGGNFESYLNAYYSYSAIFYDTRTAGGWSTENISNEYRKRLGQLSDFLKGKDCDSLVKRLNEFEITNVISSDDDCKTLKSCGLKEVKSDKHVCLYKL